MKTPLSGLEQGDMVKLVHDGLWDDTRPFIVLSPQRGIDPIIYFTTAARTKLFLDYAINAYQVDTSRIYMMGRVAHPLNHLTVGCPVLAFCARAGATTNCSQVMKLRRLPTVKVRGSHPLKIAKGGAPSSVVV